MSLMACAGSKPAAATKTAEPQVAEKAEAPASEVVADGPLQKTPEKSAETAETKVAEPAQGDSKATTCKAEQLDDKAAKFVIVVPDSGTVTFSFSLNENQFKGTMEYVIDDKVSEETAKSECEKTTTKDNDPFTNVVCNGRTITGELPLDDIPAVLAYPFITAEFAKGCDKVNETGDIEDLSVNKKKKKKETPNETTSQAKVRNYQFIECNIEFNSNVWTLKTSEGYTETIEFIDDGAKVTQDKTNDLYLPQLCQIAATGLSQELGAKAHCEEGILHMLSISPLSLEGKTKEDIFTAIKSSCKPE